MIREIKPEPPRSAQEIVELLQNMLEDARNYEITGIAIAYTSTEVTHTEAVITQAGSFPELMGVIDEVKERVRSQWHD